MLQTVGGEGWGSTIGGGVTILGFWLTASLGR
jgi:hypothetical protein